MCSLLAHAKRLRDAGPGPALRQRIAHRLPLKPVRHESQGYNLCKAGVGICVRDVLDFVHTSTIVDGAAYVNLC